MTFFFGQGLATLLKPTSQQVGLHTLGIYPVRSPVTDVWSVAMGREKRVLASADAFGRIKFFSNPGVNFQPKGIRYFFNE
jgi:hypothetical protein